MKKREDIHGGNRAAIVKRLGLKETTEVNYDFSVNINPFGMPIAVERTLAGMTNSDFSDYPEIYADTATSALAKAHNRSSDSILLGNGSTELFLWIIQSISPAKAHIIAPCYSGYAEVCRAAGVEVEIAKFAKPEDNFQIDLDSIDYSSIKLIFIATPNNPTGTTIPKEKILSTAQKNPATFFVIDESFSDFLTDESSIISESRLPANIAIVKSLTKFFAIAGIRIGMLYAAPQTVAKFAERRLPWSVNAVAQKIAPILYSDRDYICKTRRKICELRQELSAKLAEIKGIKFFPAAANFILCQLTREQQNTINNVSELQTKLLQNGIMIRNCSDIPGLDDSFFRLALLADNANRALINHLNWLMNSPSSEPQISKKTDAIMVVGTTSDAGKSVVAAALCRYFYNKGVSVAPFKAQNMSLNSFVTKEGGEMGRAQVVQAEAAKIEPHTDMNPVLLKPTGESGSQLIINGKAVCNVTARSYYEEKCEIRKDAQAAYDRLAERYDMIIIEGAGSPAEINLQKQDFVNMAMAEYAEAKTILVADINPGGVFAAIYGTVKLIPQHHRKYLSGIIINKFRGDVSLLKNGITEIEKLTGIPVLGVLPYIPNLNIEAEDSMILDSKEHNSLKNNEKEVIDIAVIRLPRISNFTDFMPLETVENVSLRYVSTPEEIGMPDLLIIPGSKNTIADMKFLQESGMEKEIKNLRNSQTDIIGICGGLQMLGETISDPRSVEGIDTQIQGLNLLPIRTTLSEKKKLTQIKGEISNFPYADTYVPFKGYEIHAGETELTDSEKEINIMTDKTMSAEYGYFTKDKKVAGTYIHGFFDSEKLRNSLLNYLAENKNADSALKFDNSTSVDKEKVYNDLANILEEYIDIDQIYKGTT